MPIESHPHRPCREKDGLCAEFSDADAAALIEEKKRLRREFSAWRKALSPEEREKRSDRICKRLRELPVWQAAETVLLYAPVRGEVDVWGLLDAALALGKRVGLPRVDTSRAGSGAMEFYALESRASLAAGAYGILEPKGECPLLSRSVLAQAGKKVLMMVPGLAFDRRGYRMGYGGGYYDRYLEDFRGVPVGIVYDALFVERLPVGRYDHRMEITVSERETVRFP